MLAMLAMPERKFGKCFRMTVVLLHLSIPKYLGLIFLVDESFCRVRYIILSSSISSAVLAVCVSNSIVLMRAQQTLTSSN
jgi:hypothetical protein